MRLVLTIDMDSETIQADLSDELGRILTQAAALAYDGVFSANLRDTNGNTVGEFEVEE